MYIKIIVLVGLVKLLDVTESPILCAGIYSFVALLFAGLASYDLSKVLITGLIALCLSFTYFWLLKKLNNSWLYWLVLIGGLIIGLV